jgi:hypothetical protein
MAVGGLKTRELVLETLKVNLVSDFVSEIVSADQAKSQTLSR